MNRDKLLYLFQKMRVVLKSNGKFQLKSNKIVENIKKSVFFNKNNTISVFFGDKYPDLYDLLFDDANYSKNIFVFPYLINNKVRYYYIESPNSLIITGDTIIPADNCLIVDNKSVDIILVPGEAFDSYNSRLDSDNTLIYDKIIRESSAVKVGVCFDCQVYKRKLPESPSKVDALLTEEGLNYIIRIEENDND